MRLLPLLLLMWLPACEDAPPEGPATFTRVEQQVFQPSCAYCHGASEFALTYANLVEQPSAQSPDDTLVIPGDADDSYLVRKLEGTDIEGQTMPPGGSLATHDIRLVRDWIDEGAAP